MEIHRTENASVWKCLRKHCDVQIGDESTLLSELHLDSLELIECLFELEQECGIALNNAELASLITVEDLLEVFTSIKHAASAESDDNPAP